MATISIRLRPTSSQDLIKKSELAARRFRPAATMGGNRADHRADLDGKACAAHGVEMIAQCAVHRQAKTAAFLEALERIGSMPALGFARDLRESTRRREVGLPALSAAFTLGGTGAASPITARISRTSLCSLALARPHPGRGKRARLERIRVESCATAPNNGHRVLDREPRRDGRAHGASSPWRPRSATDQ